MPEGFARALTSRPPLLFSVIDVHLLTFRHLLASQEMLTRKVSYRHGDAVPIFSGKYSRPAPRQARGLLTVGRQTMLYQRPALRPHEILRSYSRKPRELAHEVVCLGRASFGERPIGRRVTG